MVKEEFHVIVHCPQCGVPCDEWLTDVPRPDTSAETARDAEVTEDIELDCDECGHTFDVTIRAALLGWDAYLTEDPSETGTVEHIDYGYDDWIDEIEPEPHPRAIFDQAVREWSDLAHELANRKDGGAGINRMLFMQLFSIMEAFLSDTIIRLAYDFDEIATAIVVWNPKLANENVTLKTVAEKPDLVRDKVIASLRRMQYHNFEKVDGLTNAALKRRILPQGEEARESRALLMASVVWRHHCVHRNGHDLEGNLLDGITMEFMSKLAGLMMSMAADLDSAIDEFVTEQRAKLLTDLDDQPFATDDGNNRTYNDPPW